MKKQIRKKLLEIENIRENDEIRKKLFEKRIKFILGEDFSYGKLKTMSESQQISKLFQIAKVYNTYYPEPMINEQILGLFSLLFGGGKLFNTAIETFGETMISKVLGTLGMGSGLLFNTIVSLLTTNPQRLIQSMGNCREFTKVLSESILEGFAMKFMQKSSFTNNPLFSGLRNAIGGFLKDTSTVQKVEDSIADTVCGLFGKYEDKAAAVVDKLKQ